MPDAPTTSSIHIPKWLFFTICAVILVGGAVGITLAVAGGGSNASPEVAAPSGSSVGASQEAESADRTVDDLLEDAMPVCHEKAIDSFPLPSTAVLRDEKVEYADTIDRVSFTAVADAQTKDGDLVGWVVACTFTPGPNWTVPDDGFAVLPMAMD